MKIQEESLERPNDFQNDLRYITNDFFLKSKYLWNFKALKISGIIELHQFYNEFENQEKEITEHPIFVNPKLEFDWKPNRRNRIFIASSYTTSNSGILNLANNYYLNGFRSFSRGTNDFNQVGSWRHQLNYELGNLGNRFFASAGASYQKENDYFSTNTQITSNYSLSEAIIIDNRELFSASSNLDYYFKSIKNNFKINTAYSSSRFENIVNNSDVREVRTETFVYGMKLRSGFSKVFNYHVGSEWTHFTVRTEQNNSFVNNLSFLDLTFVPVERFTIDLKNEYYNFGNLQSNKDFYFLDITSQYSVKNNKWSFSLDARNLLNTRQFQNFNVTDISTSTRSYRLLPRIVLLKCEYRF